ncbi:MAG: GAF domain-containing protein [Gaiellaceae bacterium]
MTRVADSTASSLAGPRDLFETVLRNLSDGIVVSGRDGQRLFVNEEAARLTGYPSAAAMLEAPADEARRRFEIYDADGRPLAPDALPTRRVLAGETVEPMLLRFRSTDDGRDRVSWVSAVGVRDDAGALSHAIAFFREVTDQVQLAERRDDLYREVQQTSALLDALYGSAPVGLGFWDRELRYVRVNEELARINERSPEEHVGRTFGEVIPHLAHVIEPIARGVLERRQPVIGLEIAAGTPSDPAAPRFWRASYYPVLAPGGDALGVGCVIEEITGRRLADQRTELQHRVTRILAEADPSDATVLRVLQTVCETLGWDVACHWSADPDQPRSIWVRPGLQLEGFVATTERASLTPETLPGRVAQSGQPVWLEELTPDEFARSSVAAVEGLRTAVAFPVLVEGEVTGVLEVLSRARRDEDGDLMQSLAAIGAQLGQFLRRKHVEDERHQLLQRERVARAEAEAAYATLRKLERVTEATLAHLSLHDLLTSLLVRIVEVLDADTAAILLVEDDGALHVRATVGLEEEVQHAVAVPMGAGMAGRVAATREPALVPDLSQIELVSPVLRERGINSVVAIPLVVEDRAIGVVHAGSEAYAHFVEEDARLLELIADRIALAINQASLHEAERAAQERLQFLAEASALLSSSLEVDATLSRIAQLAVPHFADGCAVDLLDLRATIRRVAVAHGDARTGEVARQLATDFPPTLREAPLLLASAIVVPLIARGRTLGTLTFVAAEPGRQYGRQDFDFAQELGARAAVAVDNAHLYQAAERRRDRLAFLAEASDLLGSSLDVEATLEGIGTLLARRFADWVAIHVVREEGPARFAFVATRDPVKESAARAELKRMPAHARPPASVERVLGSGQPERWTGAAGELPTESLGREVGVHSRLVVPLIARSRILGTFSLVRSENPEPYDEDDVEFAEDLARRAATALDNAQLFRAAEERAQAARVLASVGDGVFLVDREGFVRTWNRAAAAATGLAEADVIDRLASEAIAGWTTVASRIPIVTSGSLSSRAESLPLDLGGRELWLSIHGVAVPDGIVYAFRDLTEERALETMRTEFVSTVSHELRTPLAAIYGAAMTLRRGDVALDDAQRATLLDVVSGEADRLARTVNDILWASRLDTDALHVTIEACDPAALARDVVGAQRAHLDAQHELVLTLADDLPHVAGDPDKVGRVLINLVDNGIKYSPDGGRVDVTVQQLGAHVRFSVTDPGLGVPAAEQRRIFEKFYRLDPNMTRGVGGTGLGLYICRELVRRMDGRIWVDSHGLGRGSTFHVELPVAGDFAAHMVSPEE